MPPRKLTMIRLSEEERTMIARLGERTGITHMSDIIRWAIRETARRWEVDGEQVKT